MRIKHQTYIPVYIRAATGINEEDTKNIIINK